MRYTVYTGPDKKGGIVRDYATEEELNIFIKKLLVNLSYIEVYGSDTEKPIMQFGKSK